MFEVMLILKIDLLITLILPIYHVIKKDHLFIALYLNMITLISL